LAAIYLDAGLDRLREVFLMLWADAFREVDEVGFGNPKSELQEWAAARKISAPLYEVTGRSGPDHAPTFTVTVSLDGFAPQAAVGRSRQEAEKSAAAAWLKREGVR
jgi:ribonuclease-3